MSSHARCVLVGWKQAYNLVVEDYQNRNENADYMQKVKVIAETKSSNRGDGEEQCMCAIGHMW